MKNIWKILVIIPIVVGVIVAGWFTFKTQKQKYNEKNKIEKIFSNVMSKQAKITKYYTYGTSLNIEGKIENISKDNFEGINIFITDGADFEKIYNLKSNFEKNDLIFYPDSINSCINLDELKPDNKYYVQIRLKVNNNKDYEYYNLVNTGKNKAIEYYTLTKDQKNNKINIKFENQNYDSNEYSYLGLTIKESTLPEDIYDFVVDSGHGGTDSGEVFSDISESNIMLEYGKILKTSLEDKGYKVKLTRDDSNTDSYTSKNMYDEDGRINIACRTKAKYMISLHTGENGYSGIQVYIPNNCDISLAEKIANNIYNNSSLEFSANNSFRIKDGIYQKNYTKKAIEEYSANLKKIGIEPYNITVNTPQLYTIRETGGIATNAYVDGRNTNYGKNNFYNSNQGIECYQISIGSLKKDKDIIVNEKDNIVNAISNSF